MFTIEEEALVVTLVVLVDVAVDIFFDEASSIVMKSAPTTGMLILKRSIVATDVELQSKYHDVSSISLSSTESTGLLSVT